MPIRSLCSWLPVCHRCCRRAISSSSLRLPSSEIPVGESTASCTSSAFERPVDGDTFPIGSLNPGGLSTNTEPRSDSSGTGIVRIAKDTNSRIRISRSGTIDRSTGIGGRLQNSRPTTTRRVNQGWWSTSSASGQNQPSDQCMSFPVGHF
ncbi:hypothetical protein BDD12DRAFT_205127 [Trichophaea hybrida]|nr:hypothetical protein BDD12DRAFT_205127 [Trichophaea hybrida]